MKPKTVVMFALAVLCPALVLAQAAATGVLVGKVVDASGGVLPGVTISLKSVEALGQFTGVSDVKGEYRVANLPPATYEVRAEIPGFDVLTRTIQVRVGATQNLDFTMVIGGIKETVTVVADAPIVDTERAGMAVNVNNTALTSLPISTSRRYTDVWALMPGANVNPAAPESGASINSRYTAENSVNVDGMNATDAYGESTVTVAFAYDAVQDMQAKMIGMDAEDVGTGGILNVVTKSGGNQLHGSAALFVIPQSFNDTNVSGIPANRRQDIQPDFTLGGPIQRDRVWFFGAYKRAQTDETINNAPVPRETRGNLFFGKITGQMSANHRASVTLQYDPTTQSNSVIRSATSSAAMQIADPTAFGKGVLGGPFVGVNYSWVVSQTKLFQLVANYSQKKSDTEPMGDFGTTRIIQNNPNDNIMGSLTTTSQAGSYGIEATSHRQMLYLYPSLSFNVNKGGSHDFKVGAQFYPRFRDVATNNQSAIEYYFRPNGTTGGSDVLFERDTFRNMGNTGSDVSNQRDQKWYGFFFQDRWRLRSNLTIKAGVRFDWVKVYVKDRDKVLSPLLPPGFPTVTADKQFDHTTTSPNAGIWYDAGKYGVFRGTGGFYYEWLGLNEAAPGNTYVVATDVLRSSPRSLAPVLNQALPGGFSLGVNYSDGNKRTLSREFSVAWEKSLPASSSVSVTVLSKNSRDHQTTDDMNIIRDPNTGALLDRPYPNYNAINRTYTPNRIFTNFTSLQILYVKNFGAHWGMNANYWYQINNRIYNTFGATNENFQFMTNPATGKRFQPSDFSTKWVLPHHNVHLSTFFRLPFDSMISMVYSYVQGPKFDLYTGDYALGAVAPRITLSNGRQVADPFFNIPYPVAGTRGLKLISADASHIVNLRLEKTIKLPHGMRLELSADAFNAFNNAAARSFLGSSNWAVDVRSATYKTKSTYVPARVGQLGVRFVF